MSSWDLDPTSRDYLLQSGDAISTNSLRIPAFYRLRTKRQTWMYAPNTLYGSDFHLISKKKGQTDTGLIEVMAARALQPLIDDGRATTIEVNTLESARYGVRLDIKITDAEGNVEQIIFTPVGV